MASLSLSACDKCGHVLKENEGRYVSASVSTAAGPKTGAYRTLCAACAEPLEAFIRSMTNAAKGKEKLAAIAKQSRRNEKRPPRT